MTRDINNDIDCVSSRTTRVCLITPTKYKNVEVETSVVQCQCNLRHTPRRTCRRSQCSPTRTVGCLSNHFRSCSCKRRSPSPVRFRCQNVQCCLCKSRDTRSQQTCTQTHKVSICCATTTDKVSVCCGTTTDKVSVCCGTTTNKVSVCCGTQNPPTRIISRITISQSTSCPEVSKNCCCVSTYGVRVFERVRRQRNAETLTSECCPCPTSNKDQATYILENETSVCVSTQCRNTTPQRDGEAQHPQAKTVASQTQKPDNEERGEQSDETASHRSSQSSDSSKSLIPCVCCKKNRIIKKLLQGAAASPLCDTCLTVSRKCCYPYDYSNPRHNCMCYYVENETAIDQLENALCQLERLEGYQQLCDVIENCNCCGGSSCKCKLPKRLKNGCAYFLKVEMERPKRVGGKSGANGKDDSSDGGDSEDKENVLPEVVIKVPTFKKEAKRKKDNYQSIQNYLCAMKPDFVERAEMRRKTLRDAALQREEKVERRKLRFIDHPSILDPHPKKVKPKVFKNFKEMKELTRRKYLHLNEVKSVKEMYKERRLREANRLVADIFTKRLQRSTLKGNVDIPLNVRVVSY